MDFEILTNSPIIFYTALVIGTLLIVIGYPVVTVAILAMFILSVIYSVIGFAQGYVFGPSVIIIITFLFVVLNWGMVESAGFKRR